ncbi:hypothetical protein J4460_04845 [Candidatus Woesearchaeota archaeon]|nr:hypothetical protein [Candidatus Woesearchaeota archaeon]HIH37383.1 hypothetical protein [Candidatus Woesearchaeota archaeon]HIH48396.1 hypothetical protein [Candidatus Woesearchaeota archaeon]HIJ04223.1 hypothetical protein [Candidatus Woesearchaeota archaeon]
MATTIQVSDTTKQLLDDVKRTERKTYDEIVKGLLMKKQKIPSSLFGAFERVKWEKKKDRMGFRHEVHD